MPAAPDHEERHRLTAFEGLAALSRGALSSVAYGPEAIVVVLAAAGTAGLAYTLPVTTAIVVLLIVLVISYRQVIAAFPGGGGAYAVAGRHLGRQPSLIAAASLIVDYVLNAAVGVSAGVAALTSAFPALYGSRVWLCLAVLAAITGINLRGVAESARIFIVPTVAFIVAIAIVIAGGLLRSHPVIPPTGHVSQVAESIGILLLLKAFASGCSALTGVEAIANAVPEFRQPRARRAQRTELWLGILLGVMLLGIAVLIRKFHVPPSATQTTLSQLTAVAVGHDVVFYAIQLITTVLLALAANTSFGGLPVLASLLVFARGNTLALVPLFAIGVFVGFTLSQVGMVRHWREQRGDGWARRAFINGLGAVLTTAALAIELVSKFTEGAWLVVIVIPLLVLMFDRVHAVYGRIGAQLSLGQQPPTPQPHNSLVIVPVGGLSRLTAEAISAALSLGDKVIAVTVCYADPEDEKADADFRRGWEQWQPDVPLITLHSQHRALGPPVVEYLRKIEDDDRYRRLVVLIPEVMPVHPWGRLLHNQRGFVLERAIQRGTVNVVICRLRYRLAAVAGSPPEKPARRIMLCARQPV